jgi:hypothetical protein
MSRICNIAFYLNVRFVTVHIFLSNDVGCRTLSYYYASINLPFLNSIKIKMLALFYRKKIGFHNTVIFSKREIILRSFGIIFTWLNLPYDGQGICVAVHDVVRKRIAVNRLQQSDYALKEGSMIYFCYCKEPCARINSQKRHMNIIQSLKFLE